ncbi:hypothetical protein [Streptomyces gardneri]|uniref:hypothetical protein n=1 Tax=Streptomyces gardneri TaxID=66892 RepID=UPI0036748036
MNDQGLGAALLGASFVLAVLVIRSAVAAVRNPGSARRDWAFPRKRQGAALFLACAGAFTAAIWVSAGPAHIPWALLAGLLVTRFASEER